MFVDFKRQELVPVIIQDVTSLQVLMLGYMNETAFDKTQKDGRVCFFSRSKNRLWVKGETSGNYLRVRKISVDCDKDAILIQVKPEGPTCHTGMTSCFNNDGDKGFLYKLQQVIAGRIDRDIETSYTNQLYKRGINKVAQKVGEEAVELVIEAKDNNDDLFKGEAADLLFHFLVLLKAKGFRLEDIEAVLKERNGQKA